MTESVNRTDAIRAEIEQTRAELADTVDALSTKLDVKARVAEKAAEARTKAVNAAGQVRTQVIVGVAAGLLVLVIVRKRRGAR